MRAACERIQPNLQSIFRQQPFRLPLETAPNPAQESETASRKPNLMFLARHLSLNVQPRHTRLRFSRDSQPRARASGVELRASGIELRYPATTRARRSEPDLQRRLFSIGARSSVSSARATAADACASHPLSTKHCIGEIRVEESGCKATLERAASARRPKRLP